MGLHNVVLIFAFALQQLLGAPFVDHLTVSPDGTVLVWKVHQNGVRNLYTNAGGSIHTITGYDQDDGQDLDNVSISPDNSSVVFLRGGTSDNASGENINPLSVIPPPARAAYIVPIAGGAPTMIAESGSAPLISPRGDMIAWTKDGALLVATLAKAATGYAIGKPAQLAIHGQVQDVIWSPDSSRIAFTNVRNDHSFVVIYAPSSKNYVYATTDFSQDAFPIWSPDSTRVAFVRVPGAREDESAYSSPSHAPWSIWVADASSGKATMVWQARRGMGAQFYPSEMSASQLLWMEGDRIAFLWEGDGWQHIYAVPARGGTATNLTPGAFEVEQFTSSLDRGQLYYATNEGDIDRRHIWTVGLNGGARAITRGSNNQWSPSPLANGGIAYIEAGYRALPHVTIAGKGALVAVQTPATYPASEMVRPRLITFTSPDGLLIHAQLFVPKTAGRHPAIIFDHGGSQRQMLAGFHYMEPYTNLYEVNQYLVNRGFAVLSINYRSGIMYGHRFRESPKYGWRGASEYQDVVAGARWMQRQSFVDGKRLGIYGLSYGGYLTAMGLARNSDIFKAGVDIAGVHNWVTIFDEDAGGAIQGTPAQRRVAYDASPIASLDRWTSPVLISQGDDDRNVHFAQGVDIVTRLRDRGVHVETLVFPNETHENQVLAHLVQRYQAATDFLARYLKP